MAVKRLGAKYGNQYAFQGLAWLDAKDKMVYKPQAKRKLPLVNGLEKKRKKRSALEPQVRKPVMTEEGIKPRLMI